MAEFAAFRALLFGASLGLAVGPLALLIVSVGLGRGLRPAAGCALGVAAADFTYALLALAVGAQLERWLLPHRALFESATALLLVALGGWLWWSAWRRNGRAAPAPASAEAIGPRGAYLLTLGNPLTIVLFVSFSGQLPLAGAPAATLGYASLIFLGSLPIQLGYAMLGAALRVGLPPRWARRANLAAALAITAFGVFGLWRAS